MYRARVKGRRIHFRITMPQIRLLHASRGECQLFARSVEQASRGPFELFNEAKITSRFVTDDHLPLFIAENYVYLEGSYRNYDSKSATRVLSSTLITSSGNATQTRAIQAAVA